MLKFENGGNHWETATNFRNKRSVFCSSVIAANCMCCSDRCLLLLSCNAKQMVLMGLHDIVEWTASSSLCDCWSLASAACFAAGLLLHELDANKHQKLIGLLLRFECVQH